MEGLLERFGTSVADVQLGVGSFHIDLGKLFGMLAILLLVWWIGRIAERGIHRLAQHRALGVTEHSVAYAIGRITRYGVWIMGTLWGLSILGIQLTNLAIVGGALGVGVGFGLQNIVSNFVSGLILMFERSLKVGDFVDLQSGVRGTVLEIAMRYTRISTNDSVDVLVPNSEFVNGRVMNWTLEEASRRIRIPFGVAYGSDKDKVKAAGLAAAKHVRGIIENERRRTDVWMTGFGDSSLNFELLIWLGPDAIRSPARTEAAALWALDDELRKAGIEVPFPQRDLHLRSGHLKVGDREVTLSQ